MSVFSFFKQKHIFFFLGQLRPSIHYSQSFTVIVLFYSQFNDVLTCLDDGAKRIAIQFSVDKFEQKEKLLLGLMTGRFNKMIDWCASVAIGK